MTDRLYYTDAYTTQFKAKIVERIVQNDREGVVLDKTYFYPASGGQPADHGTIDNVSVTDVSIRAADGHILHLLTGPGSGNDLVKAEVDWTRRFDHMQQHSGQHILSRAFIEVTEAETIGFHLTSDNVTIDLDRNTLSEQDINLSEQLANQIIWENRPISIREVSLKQAQRLPLRKKPPALDGPLRLIEIEGFDLTACGGTHVSNAGAVGMIKIIRVERRSQKLRIEFRCGARALSDYRDQNTIVNGLRSLFTTGKSEILRAVERTQEELREARRVIRKQRTALLQTEADMLRRNGKRLSNATIVSHVLTDGDGARMRALGALLVKSPGTVALLATAGSKAQLLFSRSEDAPGEMNLLLKSSLELLDSAGGGGSATMAQGGGAAADHDLLASAIARAESILLKQN